MHEQYKIKAEEGHLVFSRGLGIDKLHISLKEITSIRNTSFGEVAIVTSCSEDATRIVYFFERFECNYQELISTYKNACVENNIITPFFNKIEAERVMWDMDNMIPEASDVGLSECKRFFTFRGKKYLKVSSVMSFTGFSDATIVRLGHEEIWHIKFEDLCGLINQSK